METIPLPCCQKTKVGTGTGGVTLGRLVTTFADRHKDLPVNFVVQGRTALIMPRRAPNYFSASRSARWLSERTTTQRCAESWSVVVVYPGAATDAGVREAERAQLLPWTATLKRHCIAGDPVESPAAT